MYYQEAEFDDSDDVGQREMGLGLVPPLGRRNLEQNDKKSLLKRELCGLGTIDKKMSTTTTWNDVIANEANVKPKT